MSPNTPTLDQLAREIGARLDKAHSYDQSAHDMRIAAGKLLAEAKERVRAGEPGHTSWQRWFSDQVAAGLITRSLRDADRCIALVTSGDPVKAREEEKTADRERKRKKASRAREADGRTESVRLLTAETRIAELESALSQSRQLVSDLESRATAAEAKWMAVEAELVEAKVALKKAKAGRLATVKKELAEVKAENARLVQLASDLSVKLHEARRAA